MARKRRNESLASDGADLSTADIIDPIEQKRRKLERKLAEEHKDKPMSKKKKKRLEAYISKRLKKEERKLLIESLEKSQVRDLNMQSSASLGSKQFKSQQERVTYDLNLENRKKQRANALYDEVKRRREYHSDDSESSDSESERSEAQDQGEGLDSDQDKTLSQAPSRVRHAASIASAPSHISGAVTVEIIRKDTTQSVRNDDVSRPKDLTRATAVSQATELSSVLGGALKAGAKIVKKPRKMRRARVSLLSKQDGGRGVGGGSEGDSDEESLAEGETDESSHEIDDSEDSDSSYESVDGGSDAEDSEEWGGIAEGEEEQDEDEEEKTDASSDESSTPDVKRSKHSDFKEWADAQLRKSQGVDASPTKPEETSDSAEYKPLLPAGSGVKPLTQLPDGLLAPMGEVVRDSAVLPAQKTVNVTVERLPEIEEARQQLPVVREEHAIIETIKGHPVVVVCGETGSGKTTQIGQFLYEAGFGHPDGDNPGIIGITQPRRVAVLSTSLRVKSELNFPKHSSVVAHRIRYDSTVSPATKLLFMTDGVLLRELASDFTLSKYSVIVIDEAHERGVNTDVLIGLLSRLCKLRMGWVKQGKKGARLLRLVIMSATLRVSDFVENKTLFATPPPVVQINARQHPVTMHFARRTHPDYMAEAYKKVARIHAKLPAGGVLVFCTGQDEIMSLVKKLNKKFSPKAIEARKQRLSNARVRSNIPEDDSLYSGAPSTGETLETEEIELGPRIDQTQDVEETQLDPRELTFEDLESSDDEEDGIDKEVDTDDPMHVLPLYSLLSNERQMKVFEAPPEGSRLVVVATNVAETAVTIPNIRYVVDTGRVKERKHDARSDIQTFEVSWISKASAMQRAGRAGRTGPGHCYRLYSSAVYENYFEAHTQPEILRTPIDGLVLQMKSMNIEKVFNFPFPTPPDRMHLRKAEKTLVHLGALTNGTSGEFNGTSSITALGKSMAQFPLMPRFAKMMISGQQNGCLPYVVTVISALSVGDPFVYENALAYTYQDTAEGHAFAQRWFDESPELDSIYDEDVRRKEELKIIRRHFYQMQQRHGQLGRGSSDVFKLLSVVGAYQYEFEQRSFGAEKEKQTFCLTHFVRPKAMEDIHKMKRQLTQLAQSVLSLSSETAQTLFDRHLPPPSENQTKMIRQLILSAFIDQVAVRMDLVDPSFRSHHKGVPYKVVGQGLLQEAYIHPSSNLFTLNAREAPEFIVYQDIHESILARDGDADIEASQNTPGKLWLKTITKINPAWISVLGKSMCTYSSPVPSRTPSTKPNTRNVIVTPRYGAGDGVQLKPIQVEQTLVNGIWRM